MNSYRRRRAEPGGRNRVAIFIDGSNLYHSLDENCGRFDVDFGALSMKLCGERSHFRTYYYNVLQSPDRNPAAYEGQQKFLSALRSTPYLELRLADAKTRGEIMVEKGVDIMLATDLLNMAWRDLYDVAVVVSGDGDFAYAVHSVKDLGKHVEIAAFQSSLSQELAQAADYCEYLSPPYFDELWSRRVPIRHSLEYRRPDRYQAQQPPQFPPPPTQMPPTR